jgi:hypothetical protein
MTARGDVQISLYVKPEEAGSVLKVASKLVDICDPYGHESEFIVDRAPNVVRLSTEWMPIDNSEALDSEWAERLVAIPGVIGLELLGTPDEEFYWRWTPELGTTTGSLFEGEDFIGIERLQTLIDQAKKSDWQRLGALRKLLYEETGEAWRVVLKAYDREITSQRALEGPT